MCDIVFHLDGKIGNGLHVLVVSIKIVLVDEVRKVHLQPGFVRERDARRGNAVA